MTYHIRGNGIESFRKKIKFHLPQAIMDLSCWHYRYHDLIEKKIKPCKIYLPYNHFHSRGFTFVYDKNNKYHVGFNETDRLLILPLFTIRNVTYIYYRDLNVILTFDYIKSL